MPATRRRPPRWWVLVPAGVLLAVALVILATRWGPVTASQPAYLVTLCVVAVLGVAGVVWSVTAFRSGRTPAVRHRARVIVGRVLGVGATVVVVAALVWLRPLPATPVAVASMGGTPAVTVTDSSSLIELHPVGPTTRTGLIFYPGALVDPRAYVPLLSTMASHGFTVDIVKPPFGIAFLAPNAPGGIISSHPSVSRWVVGGHSLGGVAASSFAGSGHRGVAGLLLWASYPNGSLADRTSLMVTSVSAGNDGLATPAKIDASRSDLPPATVFVVVAGAVHADFGDYGTQRGDGTPAIGRAEAQTQIEAASLSLLERVDHAPA